MKLSVTIITLNEEANIERAIRSVSFADEVIVVDSGSTDRTRTLAENLGARVVENAFAGYGQQKNFAESLCRSEWILNLDADEEVSAELRQSLAVFLKSQSEPVFSIYCMPRRNYFCGRPIYHGGWYPDLKARLYRKGHAVWTEPHVHEDLIPLSPVTSAAPEIKNDLEKKQNHGILQGDLLHYSFVSVLSQVKTNTNYACLGAKELIRKKGRKPSFAEVLIRPFFKFIECYLLKAGFLDGKRGLIIALNAAYSMFMKYSFALMDE